MSNEVNPLVPSSSVNPIVTSLASPEDARTGSPVPGSGDALWSVSELRQTFRDLMNAIEINDKAAAKEALTHLLSIPFNFIGGCAFLYYYFLQLVNLLEDCNVIGGLSIHLTLIERFLETYVYPVVAVGCFVRGYHEICSITREVHLLRSTTMRSIAKINKQGYKAAIQDFQADRFVSHAEYNAIIAAGTEVNDESQAIRLALTALKNEYTALDTESAQEQRKKHAKLLRHFGKTFDFLYSRSYFDDLIQKVGEGDETAIVKAKSLLKDLPIQAKKRVTVFAIGILAAIGTAIALILFPFSFPVAIALFGVGFAFAIAKSRLVKGWLTERGWRASTLGLIPGGRPITHFAKRISCAISNWRHHRQQTNVVARSLPLTAHRVCVL